MRLWFMIHVAALSMFVQSSMAAEKELAPQMLVNLLVHDQPEVLDTEYGFQSFAGTIDCQGLREAGTSNEFDRPDKMAALRKKVLPPPPPESGVVTVEMISSVKDYDMEDGSFRIQDFPGWQPNPLALDALLYQLQNCGIFGLPLAVTERPKFPGIFQVDLVNSPGLTSLPVDKKVARAFVEKVGNQRTLNVLLKLRLLKAQYDPKPPPGGFGHMTESETTAKVDAKIESVEVTSTDGQMVLYSANY